MTVHELAIERVRQLPEPLAQKVADFAKFLLLASGTSSLGSWNERLNPRILAALNLPDDLANLVDYEERLARGEIRW